MEIGAFIVELDQSDCPIKDRALLKEALLELDGLIGMTGVKQAVVDQLLFFISNIKSKGLEHATDGHLLSCLLYGPSGVGKSIIGLILAKIWASFGILNRAAPEAAADSLVAKLFRDNITLNLGNKIMTEKLERAATAAEATRIKLREMRRRIFAIRTRRRHGESAEDLDDNVQRLSRISADALSYSSMACQTLLEQLPPPTPPLVENVPLIIKPSEYGSMCLPLPSSLVPQPTLALATPTSSRPNFKVISRINLVAEYVGQTAVKTRKLLEEHRGGVLFIDEAYSLYQGERDSFGSEALTVINQYMTENADSTVLIFAGYKDIMQSSIFKVQPGLARRFAFTFEIPGYTPTELADIFLLQLKKDGWSYEDRSEIITFFTENSSSFPSYGGDTMRLIFQAKLVHTSANWRNMKGERIISKATLLESFIRYKAHQPLDIERLRSIEAQRTYEEELVQLRIREHREHKENETLYVEFRAAERDHLARKVKENRDRKLHDELYDRYQEFERAQMQQRLKEQTERESDLELYDNFRGFERYQMQQRLKEHKEKEQYEPLYEANRKIEREELERKLKESEDRKLFDARERPDSMYN